MKYNLDAHYVLMNDIDCSDTINWNHYSGDCNSLDEATCRKTLGCHWAYIWEYPPWVIEWKCHVSEGFMPVGSFRGTFNEQNYSIIGLYINRPTYDNVGLFSHKWVGIISDVGLENINITGYMYVGGLVGKSECSTITNSFVNGSIAGFNLVGGLVGYSEYGTLSNSYAAGSVRATAGDVGGLVGYLLHSALSNSYATGDVSGREDVGGLIGEEQSSNVSDFCNRRCKRQSKCRRISRFMFSKWYIKLLLEQSSR